MMKKVLFIFALLFSVNSFSQLVIAEDSVYQEYDTSEEDVVIHNFHSTSSPTDTVKWILLEVNVPSSWENDAFICDATSCYDSTVNDNQYSLVDNKQKTLDVHFLNNQLIGEGTVKLLIWDVNDSMATVKTVTYHTKVSLPNGIKSTKQINISIFPNPVTNFVNINSVDVNSISSIEVFNIIGKRIFFMDKIQENNTIDMSSFNKGVYLVKVIDTNNNTFYTKNIIKQ